MLSIYFQEWPDSQAPGESETAPSCRSSSFGSFRVFGQKFYDIEISRTSQVPGKTWRGDLSSNVGKDSPTSGVLNHSMLKQGSSQTWPFYNFDILLCTNYVSDGFQYPIPKLSSSTAQWTYVILIRTDCFAIQTLKDSVWPCSREPNTGHN